MKKLFLLIVFMLFCCPVGHAILEVEKSTSPEELINAGFSSEFADMVNMQKCRSTSTEFQSIKPVKPYQTTPVYVFFRKIFTYIDPALDDNSFYNHDMKWEPSINDL